MYINTYLSPHKPLKHTMITGFGVTIIFLFIILQILRLGQLMKCLFWPLLDIVNSMVTIFRYSNISVLAFGSLWRCIWTCCKCAILPMRPFALEASI